MRTQRVFQDGATRTLSSRTAAVWLALLVLACNRSDGSLESFAGSRHTTLIGTWPPSDDSSICTTRRPAGDPEVAPGWALDPAAGECLYYANRSEAPDGWARFDSEVECRCSIENCPSTIEEAEQRLCAVASPPAPVLRFVGCCLASVGRYSEDRVEEWTFELSGDSAARILGAGRYSSGDAGSPSNWQAGVDPGLCDYDGSSTVCLLCGEDPDVDWPRCP